MPDSPTHHFSSQKNIMKKLMFLTVIMFISLLSCQDSPDDFELTDAAAEERGNNQMRPISGTIVYIPVANVNVPCDCGSLEMGGPFVGSGNVLHMGNTFSESIPCFTSILADPTNPATLIGYDVSFQCGTFVAANGDELNIHVDPYQMYLDFSCFCNFSGGGIVHFNGGTGRFSDATGTATTTVFQDLVADNVTLNFEGEINY